MENPDLTVFILAKNEEANLIRTLAALAPTGWPVTLLDSGSTDGTLAIAATHPFVTVQPYAYTTHFDAYNSITTQFARTQSVIILDADMVLSPDLIAEVSAFLANGPLTVARAPIEFWVEGRPLKHASLYPPKPFLFPTGEAWFVRSGHAERVRESVPVHQFTHPIRHDDRKPFASFLAGQARYAQTFVERVEAGESTTRDRLRARTPIMLLAVPFMSFIARLGFLDGRAGLVYALDKLIAEATMFRAAVASRMKKPQG